ncbi:serine/arginine repetitive matrix protein 4 isoform X2 [Hippocampus zosterae]|uniref:serine/arginine repetitive matrix protein 4 isoform X2 n=1 Tax=Hippocampus zosterae TaxID=109293 RepID=UPI00223DC47C|nr:serine/arginine repetitive matrix protein 4 isoform X2 [Hippocampus zosterae]
MMQTAASVQERAAMLHQKQLFEKFWKGTFKAVAMPRPESVFAASIAARSRLTRPEVEADQTPGDRRTDYVAADSKLGNVADGARKKHKAADHFVAPTDGKKDHRHRRHHRHLRHRLRHHRARSTSFGEDLSLQPKGKKKKKKEKKKKKKKKTKSKSERKRLTSRSASCSPSPLREKRKKKMKKKKKKSSKKSKRHRYTSKKSKHSGSSRFKRSPKDGRKRKRSSRSGWRAKRRRGSSASDRPSSSAEDRPSAYKTQCSPTFEAKWTRGGSVSKSVKTASVLSVACTFLSKPSRGRASGQDEQSHDCDSGNDTSSPPFCETGVADKSEARRRRASPSPVKLANRDNDVSDSGNSVTSYASLCKAGGEDCLSAALLKREHEALGCRFDTVRSPRMSSRGRSSPEWHRRRRRSMSSGSSRYSGRRLPSSSLSSASSYSRSLSYSLDLRQRRGSLSSVSSRGSYFRRRRSRSRTRTSSSRETDGDHKISRKRRRRKSYSPVRKRRRDSPSHLEARRITSARKRPVPYLRRSPSSCSSLSAPSPRSLFHLCRRSVSSSSSSSASESNSRSSSWSFEARQRSASRY